MYKRILLKLSGEALSGQGTNFDPEILKSLASQIKEIQDLAGATSSAAKWRKKWELSVFRPTTWACWQR